MGGRCTALARAGMRDDIDVVRVLQVALDPTTGLPWFTPPLSIRRGGRGGISGTGYSNLRPASGDHPAHLTQTRLTRARR